MAYAIIWFGSAWIYWFIWLFIWVASIPVSGEFVIFLLTWIPSIIFIADIVLSIMIYRKQSEEAKNHPDQKREYNRKKYFGNLTKIVVGVLATFVAYMWLLFSIVNTTLNIQI